MKRFINMMTAFTVTVTTVSTATMVVSCKGDYMVTLHFLTPSGPNNSWIPAEGDKSIIIEIDKRDIKKYTLWGDNAYPDLTEIDFYMKDGTVNSTSKRNWSGPKSEYEKYFTKELGFGPDIEQE
ncbi:hypothetical protein [Spiroplasma culicicola]|uniref:Lipoprotein n=1 Tax=Spiroplasma culicicola AES-1 TaxID=1276246 RepID=W6A5S1_9MOLU|nr:hypothetical protein [Spiroplasma culicicola]AHI52483.1 hypothetical protein SCULI_v1c01420 [Spiroplasma culicicola AES-1]